MTGERIAKALVLAALLCAYLFAQSMTGSLLGTVTDSSNAAIPNVLVEIKNLTTGFVRTTTSGPEGIFRFNSLEPAKYDLTIKPTAGFKAYAQNSIDVTANEVRDLGRLALALGSLTEEIAVTAAATPVQTASSENSKLVDSTQMADLTLKGRDMFAALATVPGVSFGDAYMTPGTESTSMLNGLVNINLNGVSGSNYDAKINFQVDGISTLDTGSNSGSTYEPTMDSIVEVRVMTTNYQAEYGRGSGGTISVVTRGGSQEFHGTAYANKRHEEFNANSFFNNYNGLPKSLYRFFVFGYSVGGPVAIPKLPNRLKKKLFFFFSQEYTRQTPATDVTYAMLPTVAQRAGNFAGYANGTGQQYTLHNPLTGNPLTGNNLTSLIGTSFYEPASAAYGQAMLNFFPLPNLCNAASGATPPAGCTVDPNSANNYTRNYVDSFNESHPRRNDTVRIDWNVTSRLTSWFRYIADSDDRNGGGGIALKNSQGQWAPVSYDYPQPGHGYGVGITYTISPTLVNEFTFGKNFSTYDTYAHDPSQFARANMGSPPSFDNFATDPRFVADQNLWRPGLPPGNENYMVGVPGVTFGGGQEPGETGFSNSTPYTNFNNIYTFNDAISKTWRRHNFKAGLYWERNTKREQQGTGSYLGSYSFASTAIMTSDVQDGFGNAWLGNFNTYSEGMRNMGNWWTTSYEAFVQDNWRVTPRLTLDLGVRFTHDPPVTDIGGTGYQNTAEWVASTYNAAAAERIYLPGCTVSTAAKACPTANEYAIDPGTGYTTFYTLNGTLVPASVGGYSTTPTPFPGMQVATGTNPYLPLSLYTTAAFPAVPRFGFAWDVFGNGKTAIRGGVGGFLNRGTMDEVEGFLGQPPSAYSRSIYYSTINQIPNFANSAAIAPIAPGGLTGEQKIEGAYNGSFMIQQRLGFGTVLEASYVFNLRRHLESVRQINAIPIYGEYNPSWASPMTGYLYANASGKDLSDNYFRPIKGLGAMTQNAFGESSDYNALQVNVRRNMTKHLSYGFAYTFAKTMNAFSSVSSVSQTLSPYWPDKFRNWGPSYFPAPQVLVVNYVYEVPDLGRKLNFKPMGWVTDHWTVSGMTQLRSDRVAGVPGISFTGSTSTSPTPNFTGSAEGARMFVEGSPQLPGGQASFVGGPAVATSQGNPAANGYGPNGTPGNQLLNESAFVIPYPCSYTPASTPQMGIGESMECFGNAGAGSIVTIPGTRTNNWDMTFSKNFPLKSERRVLVFRAEMYNIFNHTQFNGWSVGPTYDWNNWKNGVNVQTASGLGRYTGSLNPRQMSMSLRLQF